MQHNHMMQMTSAAMTFLSGNGQHTERKVDVVVAKTATAAKRPPDRTTTSPGSSCSSPHARNQCIGTRAPCQSAVGELLSCLTSS